MNELSEWSARHFSQSNPSGDGQDDVVALLRRVAATLETFGQVYVMDLVLHREIDDDGLDSPSITVYYAESQLVP